MQLLDCIKGHQQAAEARGHHHKQQGPKVPQHHHHHQDRFTDVTCRAMTYHCIVTSLLRWQSDRQNHTVAHSCTQLYTVAHSCTQLHTLLQYLHWRQIGTTHFSSQMSQVQHNTQVESSKSLILHDGHPVHQCSEEDACSELKCISHSAQNALLPLCSLQAWVTAAEKVLTRGGCSLLT